MDREEEGIVRGCLAGDAEALARLDELLRGHTPKLRAMGMEPSAIDDVIADVRARLIAADGDRAAALLRYDGRGSLAGYVRAIVVRLAIDRLRAARPTASLDEVDEVAAFAISLEAELTKQAHADVVKAAFRRAWEDVPPHQRLLLSQQVIDQLSIDEIAAVHGVHRATAARRCVAAREALLVRLRGALREALGVDTATAESILFAVASRLSGVVAPHVG
ncbi:MAG: sigma-70 family RNA polymerase sigma factor [Kofleriaceae bacterium]|nr:sigma-70 family RNA polymerase sigma factor [Kofleriaceae bacterium]